MELKKKEEIFVFGSEHKKPELSTKSPQNDLPADVTAVSITARKASERTEKSQFTETQKKKEKTNGN